MRVLPSNGEFALLFICIVQLAMREKEKNVGILCDNSHRTDTVRMIESYSATKQVGGPNLELDFHSIDSTWLRINKISLTRLWSVT